MTDYRKAVKEAEKQISDLDRHRCQYAIDGMRCTAPGTCCEAAQWDPMVKDPHRYWLCAAHYRLRGDRLGSREVIADLIAHPPTHAEDWRERMLYDYGLEEIQTAWRDMTDYEKAALKANIVRQVLGFIRQATGRSRSADDSGRHA